MTQQEFADMIGVALGTYQRVEPGLQPLSVSMQEKIANTTGCGRGLDIHPDHPDNPMMHLNTVTLTQGQTDAPFTRDYFLDYRARMKVYEAFEPVFFALDKITRSVGKEAARKGLEGEIAASMLEHLKSLCEKHELNDVILSEVFISSRDNSFFKSVPTKLTPEAWEKYFRWLEEAREKALKTRQSTAAKKQAAKREE